MLLVVIGGAVDKNPTNQFYFLQADTSAIPGAPATSRWTFWNTCGDTNGRNVCPHVHPAYAFDPQKNFGTTTGVPASLVQQYAISCIQSIGKALIICATAPTSII